MPLAGKMNPDYDAAIPLLISRACEKFWLVSIELIARLEREVTDDLCLSRDREIR